MSWDFPPCPYAKIEKYQLPRLGIKLDLGCARVVDPNGFIGVDVCSPLAGVLCNFEHGLPFRDSTVDFLRCSHVLEHLEGFIEFMDECWRVLKDGPLNRLLACVPRADGWHAYGDPEHRRFFHPNTFLYFTPYWHYENRVRKWEITDICWCYDQEIRVLMKPIKQEARMRELTAIADGIRKEQGHGLISFQ